MPILINVLFALLGGMIVYLWHSYKIVLLCTFMEAYCNVLAKKIEANEVSGEYVKGGLELSTALLEFVNKELKY